MKKFKISTKFISVSLIIVLLTVFNAINLNGQEISFKFTANHTCEYAALDSVFIENLTQEGDTTLYYPDTVLTIILTGINENFGGQNGFYVSQNYPNPFETKTDINVFVPEHSDITLNVYDFLGRIIANYEGTFDRGMQHFTFFAGNSKCYILTISSGKYLQHIQMIQFGKEGNSSPTIEYNGSTKSEEPEIKPKTLKSYFPYELGDELKFTGYVSVDYTSITDNPTSSEEYFFDINNTVPAQPGAISGNTTVCENATGENYSISPVNEASFYTWTVPSGATITNGQGTTSIIVNFGINSGDICVTADNGCGQSEQNCSAITVNTAPSITSHPSNSTICEGDNASFSVTATGTGLTYQWQVNTGSDWDNITAAGSNPIYANWTTATLSLNNTIAGNNGYQYRCVVNGTCGSATSNSATLTVITAPSSVSATAATNIVATAFSANWTATAGATSYYLDVSTVSNFSSFVTGYNNLNVGNVVTYSVTGLTCATTYYYRVRANNSCGTSPNSNTITVTTGSCGTSCGTQVWAIANINVGTRINGTSEQNNNSQVEKYCYNDVDANCTTYGGLYQWAEAMQIDYTYNSNDYPTDYTCDPCGSSGRQGICPSGYHIPTDLEWSHYEWCIETTIAPTGSTSLNTFQNTTGWRGTSSNAGPGAKMKVTSSHTPAWDGTNASGFSALPAGYRYNSDGSFDNLGSNAGFWSATEYSGTRAWYRDLITGYAQSYRNSNSKAAGFSVRCLQD